MVLLQDGVIAFLSAVGLTAIVWLAAGAILHTGRPTVPGLLLVLPLRGEVPALEEDVRELRRVRRQLPGARDLSPAVLPIDLLPLGMKRIKPPR